MLWKKHVRVCALSDPDHCTLARIAANLLSLLQLMRRGLGFATLYILQLRLLVCNSRTSNKRVLKLSSSLLGAWSDGDDDSDGDDGRCDTHDWSIARNHLLPVGTSDQAALSDRVDDLSRRRRDHVSNLICQTRETRSEGSGRQLVQVDGNNTPGALNEELHEETGGRKAHFTLR